MKHAFISYSHKDSAFVERLERDLNARGVVTWRDETSIPGGTDWHHGIETGLANAYAVICIVTPNADASKWVKREQLRAAEDGISCIAVLPRRHRMPIHLQEVQPIHMGDEEYADGVARLAAALERCARDRAEAMNSAVEAALAPTERVVRRPARAEAVQALPLRPAHRPYEPTPLDIAIAKPDPIQRAAAFRDLADKGQDNRPGIGLKDDLPDIDWCKVPAGPFTYRAEKKPHHLEAFAIGRYPVTHLQFQAFVDAPDGFADPRWWKGLSLPEDHNAAPGNQTFKFRNHPRERVSWYEAIAFCRWCSYRLGGGYHLDRVGEWLVRLPTEYEWEKAARGTDGRDYPYEGKYDPAQGNSGNTGIGQTSAVGIFQDGASPCGALDMSGNVWEWCLTDYRNPAPDAAHENLRSNVARVLRGGSWLTVNADLLRATYRGRDVPDDRDFSLGFRCARSL